MDKQVFQNEREMKSYLEALVKDTEELIGETSKETSEKAINARNKLKLSLASIKYRVHLIENSIIDKTRETNKYVHENPWKSMGIASMTTLGVGLILGFFMGRESNK